MSHALTLALVHALLLQSALLLHVAAAGWTAARLVPADALTLAGAATAAALGMALAIDAVTAGTAITQPGSLLAALGWLGGIALPCLALLIHESTRTGRLWRAMATNAQGLVAIGVPARIGLALGLGLALAAFAGLLAPPPALTDWLPAACLALFVIGARDRPRGRAVLAALLAWLAGAAIGGLELFLEPALHGLATGLVALILAGLAVVRLDDGGRWARAD